MLDCIEIDRGLIIVGVELYLIIDFVVRRLEMVCVIKLLYRMVEWLLVKWVEGGV